MAERPLDRLLPTAIALVFGTVAAAAGIAGVAADFLIGRPSSSSGLGIVFMLPLVLLAAVVGYAIGHGIGAWLRRNGVAPGISMRPYRVVMTFVLGVAIVIGATIGARPVIRQERLHQPRVLAGADAVDRQAGAAADCPGLRAAPLACNPLDGRTTYEFIWNGRDVTLGCTRGGTLTITDERGGVGASADLSAYEYVRDVHLALARQADGREAVALLARLRAIGRREMFMIVDADGRVIFQELMEAPREARAQPLAICPADDSDTIVVSGDTRTAYRPR